jgi:internalin A
MSNTIHQYGSGDNFAGDKVMGDKVAGDKIGTQISQAFNQSNIGSAVGAAHDQAQVTASNITQTSGTSTAELLQIIATLRQTAAQFPQSTQEDIIIDIDDVEAEIQRPADQRNIPKLKKRLTAILTAASLIAGTVAGVNEFADHVIDLGSKIGIELQLPAAP